MHLLTGFSLKNRALIALVTIVAAVFGLLSVNSLKQELMPSVEFPAVAVITSYPGASPEIVNNDVSGPIETALRSVPQLESTTATSSTGASMVVAQFTYGVDVTATEQKVERAISRISQLLPDTSDTQVMSGSIDDFPVIQIAATPANGDTPEEAAALLERIVIPAIGDIDGVRDAQLSGARADRVTITPNLTALSNNGLTSQVISDALQQNGMLMAAGTVADGDFTLAVQMGSAVESAEAIAELPIPLTPEALLPQELPQQMPELDPLGNPILGAQPDPTPAAPATPLTIGDIATVEAGPGPEESISRVNGEAALTIGVTKMSAANTVEVSHAVLAELDALDDQIGGMTLTVVFDQAPYIEQEIHTLTTEGLLGLVFAVLVILVFLMSVRATLVTAISIPTSLLLTFVGLNFADYTLNMLTLGALTISIGRVVDDSIVVIENIKRHLTPGVDKVRAIVFAVREVAGAITASTAATIAVFLPIALVDGMVGEMFRPFAFTSAIALAASLFVSLTIVPVLAYWFLKPERARRGRGAKRGATVEEPAAAAELVTGAAAGVTEADAARTTPRGAMQRGYLPIIEWTLKRPAITLLAALLVFGATIAATPFMKTNYMGDDSQNSIGLTQTLEPGASLDAQLAQVEQVEEALETVEAVDIVQVSIGGSSGGMAAIFGGGGDGAVSYSITTDADADQAEVQEQIREAVATIEDGGDFSLGQSGGGMTMSSAIEIEVNAPDQETLAEASDAVVAALQEQPGLRQVESDLGTSRPFLEVRIDRVAAAAAGLSEAAVAGQVAQLMQPNQIGQITVDEDTLAVYLDEGKEATDVAGVSQLPVQTALGERRLGELATVEVADGPVTVRTQDGARMVTVSALPIGDDLTVASTEVTAALDSVNLPTGASAAIGGVMSQQAEAFEQLGIALLAAILIVYVLMVATFRSLLQPLLLLISVPFAATGAILLLIATGIPLGVASLIGVLMLIGIVVTNAIVLIDLVNQYRERGDNLRDAVVGGSLQRLRPIVMTALATILALTPMGLGLTGRGGFISQPLALVVIGGLLSSTVLTLIVLPALYYIVERWRLGRSEPRGPRRKRRGPQPSGDSGAVAVAGAGVAGVAGAGLAAGAAGAGAAGASAGAGAADDEAVRSHAFVAVPVSAQADNDDELGEAEEASVNDDADVVPEVDQTPVSAFTVAGREQGVLFVSPDIDADGGSADADVSAEAGSTAAADAAEATAAETEASVSSRAQHGRHEPAPAEEEPRPVGAETAQMSLALSNLGFSDDDEAAEPEAPLELPADERESVAESEPVTEEEPVVELADAEPSAAPKTVTGEIDWEQLMWQATQDVAAAEAEEAAKREAEEAEAAQSRDGGAPDDGTTTDRTDS